VQGVRHRIELDSVHVMPVAFQVCTPTAASNTNRSSDAIEQVQQRAPVDGLSEEAYCASLKIVVFRMLAPFACDIGEEFGESE
jgi:hypothetical protein